MGNKPEVSIIMLVYNVENMSQHPWILLNQTFKDFELICINDGSTDKCWDIVKNMHPKTSVKIFRIKNMGQSISRNFV